MVAAPGGPFMSKHVDYYFTPLSPWTFLGHRRFVEIVGRHGASVRVCPVDFGPIFARTDGLPLHERPKARQDYRMLELRRWSAQLNIPITLTPRYFPANGELACRLILAAQQAGGQEAALRLTGAVGQAVWQQERDIADPATLAVVAGECGLDAAALLARARDPALAALRGRMGEEALAAGVFGAPSYVVEGEIFWGQDRLDFLDRTLAA
jgi:2-hydroxychromene-2-carboxylate isomerase